MIALWKFFVIRKQFTYLLIGSAIVAGLVSIIAIPKESAPEVDIPIGIVTTVLPGASAEDIEKLVTAKIEDSIANVENINKISSFSSDGVSQITAEFSAKANIEEAIADLKEAVDRAKPELPTDAEEPRVSQISFSDQPIIIASIASDVPGPELTRLGNMVRDDIKTISGVSRVEISGTRDREIAVIARAEALAQYNISLTELEQAIRSGNTSLPIGALTINTTEYGVRFESSLLDEASIKTLPVAIRNGSIIYVDDVAEVALGLEKTTGFSRISTQGAPSENALTISIFKKSGGNITAVSRDVRNRLSTLQDEMFGGTPILITYDAGEYVEKDLKELSRTGLLTVVLVMLVLIVALGWREAFIAGLSIPLSFTIAFVGLYASGNTINFISLFSLILAIGILVDSGIVVAEAIHTRYRILGSATEAAYKTLEEYAWPLTAGTMTTIAVFVPLFFLSGITGEFIASIPFTIIFVLLASIIVALGFVPLIASDLIRKNKKEGWFEHLQEDYTNRIRTWYESVLCILFEKRRYHRAFFLGIIFAFFFALSLPMTGVLKVIFFPGDNGDLMTIEIEKPVGTTLVETDFAIRSVEEILYQYPLIDSFVTNVGSGSIFGSGGSGAHLGSINITLVSDRKKTSGVIANELREMLQPIPNLTYRVSALEGGPPTGSPIAVRIYGNNLSDLDRAGAIIAQALRDMTGTENVTTSTKDNGIAIALSFDRTRAAELGISPLTIGSTLRTAISGSTVGSIETGVESIDIRVRLNLNEDYRDPADVSITNLDTIRQIPLASPYGPILLGALLEESIEEGRASIQRENRERTTVIQSDIQAGENAIEITNKLMAQIPSLNLPDSVRVSFGGDNEEVNRSFMEMGLALIAGLILMLAVLVLEFNSFRYSAYILVIVPLTLIGVFFGLTLLGQPLSFPAMLGIIALSGVVVNNAIILLDSMLTLRKKEPQLELSDLVVRASSARLRPILLTTITTGVGMVPLMTVSPIWAPLAVSVMFGLIFALVLTLVTIPLLIYRFPGKQLEKQ